MKRAIWLMGMPLAIIALWIAAASGALSNDDACQVAKLKAVGDYVNCRVEEQAKAITLNVPPGFTLCDQKLAAAWAKAENTYGAACPSIGDLDAVKNRLIGDSEIVSLELGGSTPAILARMPASGQSVCYEPMDYHPIDCAGTGQDAEFMAGVPRADEFKDNGDGTISDVVTGLMWEKKTALDEMPDAANPHDADNRYSWAGSCSSEPTTFCYSDAVCPPGDTCLIIDGQGGAMTVFDLVARLNEGTGFAGYTDWRVPNIRELGTLICYGTCIPATPRIFHMPGCDAGCTAITDPACSCTAYYAYWSSTTSYGNPPSVWWVEFGDGRIDHNNPNYPLAMRAVRGGL